MVEKRICDTCGKSRKLSKFPIINGKTSTTCNKCLNSKNAAKYLIDILPLKKPNESFDEDDFLKENPQYKEHVSTLKEKGLITSPINSTSMQMGDFDVISNFLNKYYDSSFDLNAFLKDGELLDKNDFPEDSVSPDESLNQNINDENKKLLKEKSELEKQIKIVSLLNKEYKDEISDLKAQNEKLNTELDSMASKYDSLENVLKETEAKSKDDLENAIKRNDDLIEEISKHSDKISILQKQNVIYKNEITSLNKANRNKKNEVSDLRNENRRLNQELYSQKNANEYLNKKVYGNDEEVSKLKSENYRLNQEINHQKNIIEGLNKKLDKNNRDVSNLTSKNYKLNEKLSKQKTKNDSLIQYELDSENEIIRLKKEKGKLTKQIDNANATINSLNEKNENLEKEKEKLTTLVNSLTLEKNQLTKKIDAHNNKSFFGRLSFIGNDKEKAIMSNSGDKLCPKCGTKKLGFLNVCPKCGYRFDEENKKSGKSENKEKPSSFKRCSKCESLNHKNNDYCYRCGHVFVDDDSKNKNSSSAMEKCPKCGAQNPHNHRFCSKCGAKIEKNIKKCSYCGYENPKNYKFCSKCGNKLKIS